MLCFVLCSSCMFNNLWLQQNDWLQLCICNTWTLRVSIIPIHSMTIHSYLECRFCIQSTPSVLHRPCAVWWTAVQQVGGRGLHGWVGPLKLQVLLSASYVLLRPLNWPRSLALKMQTSACTSTIHFCSTIGTYVAMCYKLLCKPQVADGSVMMDAALCGLTGPHWQTL